MDNKNDYKEEKFDSFLNKTIIFTSITYFKKQSNISNKEQALLENYYGEPEFSGFMHLIDFNDPSTIIDNIEISKELNNALNSLSAIEQAVIFLLYHEELSQKEAAEILDIYSKTVSKVKTRAINKLKKYMKGDIDNNEK